MDTFIATLESHLQPDSRKSESSCAAGTAHEHWHPTHPGAPALPFDGTANTWEDLDWSQHSINY